MFPIEKSDLYQFHLLEEAQIAAHKWVLSEQVGRDVGMDYARWSWHWRHRDKWVAALKASGERAY